MYHPPLGLKITQKHNFKPLCLVLAHARIQEFSPGGGGGGGPGQTDKKKL